MRFCGQRKMAVRGHGRWFVAPLACFGATFVQDFQDGVLVVFVVEAAFADWGDPLD